MTVLFPEVRAQSPCPPTTDPDPDPGPNPSRSRSPNPNEVSTVTYLESEGGPTLILNQTTPDGNAEVPETLTLTLT